MVHGVFNPQYQRYGKKILVGTYLKYLPSASLLTFFSGCHIRVLDRGCVRSLVYRKVNPLSGIKL